MLKGGQRGRGTQSTTNFLRVLTSAEVATIFSSVSTSLNQLGTRVLHTKVARSHLVDLVNIVLSSSHSSNRVIIGASLEFRPPFVTHPRYMSGVKHTFMLFSAAQRHAAWDICSRKSLEKRESIPSPVAKRRAAQLQCKGVHLFSPCNTNNNLSSRRSSSS